MPKILQHRKTRIVTLGPNESIAQHCLPGDIAIVQQDGGWWTYFIDENEHVEGYDEPFDSYNRALWTTKAAAEFAAE